MLPFADDEESVIARLESRVAQVSELLAPLRERCVTLETERNSALAERDEAVAQATELTAKLHKSNEELDALRAKQKEAAQRVRALIEQIDRLGLFDPPKG